MTLIPVQQSEFYMGYRIPTCCNMIYVYICFMYLCIFLEFTVNIAQLRIILFCWKELIKVTFPSQNQAVAELTSETATTFCVDMFELKL